MDGRELGLRGGELTPLDPRRSYKPLDVGNGVVSGTLAPNGRWLSLGTAHPVHGRVVLTTMAPFAGDRFAPDDVRAYRAALADPARPSFGIRLLDQEPLSTWMTEDSFPSGIVEARQGRLEWAVALGRAADPTIEEARRLARDGEALLGRDTAERRRFWSGLDLVGEAARPARRAVSYAIDCAASRVSDATAMLADHEILPLVWTRDAYYVCRALLAVGARDRRLLAVVTEFIRWTFEVAERVDGWWPRASLASGKAKDPAFQLDQQLFPLLLAADAGRLAEAGVDAPYAAICRQTVDALLEKRTPFGLIATDETPADDPLAQPYHFSSHVLLWRVLQAYAHPEADAVRDATLLHFTDAARFAYAVSGPRADGARHYHDANDFPTVFAPGWGFCSAKDPRWRATIDFAWSEANEGYFSGPVGGLGSVHTPDPWPLGDLQEIVVARVLGDPERERRARDRLDLVQMWDGMLPEAYDEGTGAVASRHWFAWPAAVRTLIDREPMLTAP